VQANVPSKVTQKAYRTVLFIVKHHAKMAQALKSSSKQDPSMQPAAYPPQDPEIAFGSYHT
jgi:hypothetical protein